MGLVQQFGPPRGLVGAVVGRGMAKGNVELSRWVVEQAAQHHRGVVRHVAELGPGPGVGLEALLVRFPEAQVWGVDPSSVMVSQSRKRNRSAVTAGRLTLLEADVAALVATKPVDVIMANHVVYFWRDPLVELAQIRDVMRPGGVLALGYQLRRHMPGMAQKHFPRAGHRLYEAADELAVLALGCGFDGVTQVVKGPPEAPEGRVLLATA